MLKVRALSLLPSLTAHLDKKQVEIDKEAGYAAQVKRAEALWDLKRRPVFESIREALTALSPGPKRCHYCEDSEGDEVEHIWPKVFYPSRTFKWHNYLLACGPCNGSFKREQFAVFDAQNEVVELARRKGAPVVEAPAGTPVFIDLRVDDPFALIELDLATGIFTPLGAPGSVEYLRAKYTLRVLGLNLRDHLTKMRRSACQAYVDSAYRYMQKKAAGASADELQRLRQDIAERAHPSVWAEIKRQHNSAEFRELFAAAPELLDVE